MWEISEQNKLVAGLLLRDLPVLDTFEEEEKSFISYPFSIVMTQACDIERYCKAFDAFRPGEGMNVARQIITQIIFCPAFDEDKFVEGTHLSDQYNYKMEKLNSGDRDKYRKNDQMRYHYIEIDKEGIPNLFIDFKQYFTLPAQYILVLVRSFKDTAFKLEHIHYTHIADRFAYYLQRVAPS